MAAKLLEEKKLKPKVRNGLLWSPSLLAFADVRVPVFCALVFGAGNTGEAAGAE